MLRHNTKGFTLIELLVALTAGAAVIATLSFLWINITRNTTGSMAKSMVATETNRIGTLFINELKQNTGVIRLQESSVRFVGSNGLDTVEYSFDQGVLKRNGDTVHSPYNEFTLKEIVLSKNQGQLYSYSQNDNISSLLTLQIIGTHKHDPRILDTLILKSKVTFIPE